MSPRERALFLSLAGLAAAVVFSEFAAYDLWSDEAWVAVSIAQTGLRDMFFFEIPQSTPPLLLLLMRGLVRLMGPHDWVFRLWPALAGVMAAPLIFFVCRRLTGSPGAGFFCMSLWAVNPVVVRYSQEVKQYTTDAMVGLSLILLAERAIERHARGGDWRPILTLTLVAAIFIGLSHSAVFFVAAIALRLAWYLSTAPPTGKGRRHLWAQWAIFVGATLTVFGLIQWFLIRPQLADWLVEFWRSNYLPVSGFQEAIGFIFRETYGFFWFLFGGWANGMLFGRAPLLFASIGLVGILAMLLDRRTVALLYLATPFVLTLLASALERYPYGGVRTDLFLAPLLFICVAYGLHRIIATARLGPRGSEALGYLVILFFPFLQLVENRGRVGKVKEDVSSAVRTLEADFRPGDLVGVHPSAYYAYYHYSGDTGQGVQEVGSWDDSDLASAERDIGRLIDSLSSPGRLWLVFSGDRGNHRQAYRDIAEAQCDLSGEWIYEGAALFRYRCEPSRR